MRTSLLCVVIFGALVISPLKAEECGAYDEVFNFIAMNTEAREDVVDVEGAMHLDMYVVAVRTLQSNASAVIVAVVYVPRGEKQVPEDRTIMPLDIHRETSPPLRPEVSSFMQIAFGRNSVMVETDNWTRLLVSRIKYTARVEAHA